jgi:hypothetical protein
MAIAKDWSNMPVLPYGGTSGWSGSETSRLRAIDEDSNGTTAGRQQDTLNLLFDSGVLGMTWKELSDQTGWHHGSASGVLSVLHKEGLIVRLKEKRNRCAIYILERYVQGRELSDRKIRRCGNCGCKI